MAVTKKNASCKVALKVETGEDASGKTKYGTRTISKIDPAVTDANLYAFAGGVAGLITTPTDTVTRTDAGELIEA